MYRFEITVRAFPTERRDVMPRPVKIEGHEVQALRLSPETLTDRLPVSFEEAEQGLSTLPRMYCEPDGSFVWVSQSGESPWQVDGNLYDRDGSLILVDLNGTCPVDQLNQLLRAFGWPGQPLLFQLIREAVFLDETEFRRFASQ